MTKYTIAILLLLLTASVQAQETYGKEYLGEINKQLPHKFKELKMGVTVEAVRDQSSVQIYMLIDDIEQYEQVLVERSDELQTNFSQCKLIQVQKGKYKNNYVEVTDQYPLSSKMNNLYRVKTITSEGIVRMYPPVLATVREEQPKAQR